VAIAKIRAPAEVVSTAVTNAHVAIGGADGVAWLRALDGGPLRPLRGHSGGVTGVGLSPDAAHVATGDEGGDVRIWQLPSGRLLHVLRGHRDLVTSAVFSAGGGKLATASRDRDARIWSVAAGRPLQTLVGHFAIVSEASFSPDDRMVVTAGPVSAGLWLRAGEAPGYLRGHSSKVTSAAFAPDGITIVTASRDGTVRRFRCALCQPIDGLLRLARERLALTGRAMTRAERARYLGES
jgi:WD40 repeat protein